MAVSMSKEIVTRLSALESAQNSLANRVALVESEQKHGREIFESRFDAYAAQIKALEATMLAWDVKLEKILNLVTAATTDNMASAAGRAIVSDIAEVKAEIKTDIAEVRAETKTELADIRAEARLDRAAIKEACEKIKSWGSVIAVAKWIGAPGLLAAVVGTIWVAGKVNHLW